MNGLSINLLLFLGILVLPNSIAYFLGLRFKGNDAQKRLWFEPPGYVIPFVWLILFGLLAVLRHELVLLGQSDLAWMILILALVCSTYTYYTLGLEKLTGISALKFGLGGNLLVILVAIWVGDQVATLSSNLSYFIFPIVAWTIYATMILIGQLRLAKN